jgi:hypothetical protein
VLVVVMCRGAALAAPRGRAALVFMVEAEASLTRVESALALQENRRIRVEYPERRHLSGEDNQVSSRGALDSVDAEIFLLGDCSCHMDTAVQGKG